MLPYSANYGTHDTDKPHAQLDERIMTNITTASGIPVADNQNSITAGPRGPVLLQDFHLIEKLQHFNRERIPERYHDAQLYRVGANHQHLPVNQSRCPFHNQQRDGAMAFDNGGAAPNYDPVHPGLPTSGGFGHGDGHWELNGTSGRYETRVDDDHYTQAGNLYRLLGSDAKCNLIENIAASLGQADPIVQERQVAHFMKADPSYGQGVAAAIRQRQGE